MGEIIKGDQQLKSYITQYYKGLFGPSECGDFRMEESRTNGMPQISAKKNERLIAQFTEKVVKEAIFQMKHNKAPGLDGFPLEFYQVFWEVVKDDLMVLFKEFHNGTLPLFSLHFGTVTLLLKQREASRLHTLSNSVLFAYLM